MDSRFTLVMGFLLDTSFLRGTNVIVNLFLSYLYNKIFRTMTIQTLETQLPETEHNGCGGPAEYHEKIRAIRDAMEILSGKWKIQLIGTLRFSGKKRFMDLLRHTEGIAAKMLSKELQDLEANKLVKRTVMNTKPITVEYEITEYGKSLDKVISEIVHWGVDHRKKIMEKENM